MSRDAFYLKHALQRGQLGAEYRFWLFELAEDMRRAGRITTAELRQLENAHPFRQSYLRKTKAA